MGTEGFIILIFKLFVTQQVNIKTLTVTIKQTQLTDYQHTTSKHKSYY